MQKIKKSLGGLSTINIELTNRCNKNCWFCGRRERENRDPSIIDTYGDMDLKIVKKISQQIPNGVVVQFHNNGESLLYPSFGKAVSYFDGKIKNVVTNGKLLLYKYDEIVENLDTISISVIENDPEADEQYKIIKEFIDKKKDKLPQVIIRCNGDVQDIERYKKLGVTIAYRQLHSPLGSFNYVKRQPTIPEVGICWDFLHHLAINKDGDVSICVRFDPERAGVLGNINDSSLLQLWNSDKRTEWLKLHMCGKRNQVPLCSKCEFFGVPTGA